MTARTKVIIAGAAVTALIGLIVIDLVTAPGKKPDASDLQEGHAIASTQTPSYDPPNQIPRDPPPDRLATPSHPSTHEEATHTGDEGAIVENLLNRMNRNRQTPRIPSPVPQPDPPNRYTVVDGDSFWSIAGKVYGKPALFKVVQKANPNVGEFDLRAGMKLHIPPKPAPGRTTPTRVRHRPTNDPTVEIYLVKRNDTLWDIARPYARARGANILKMVAAIQEANPDVNPRKMRPNTELRIPR